MKAEAASELNLHLAPEEETPPQKSAEELLATKIQAKGSRQDAPVSLRNEATMAEVTIESVRMLEESDLRRLRKSTEGLSCTGDQAPSVMRTSHHAMAKDAADGVHSVHLSRIYGLSLPTVKLLLESPAFQELMHVYGESLDKDITFPMDKKMSAIAHDGLDEIRERLMENPKKFSTSQLLELSGDMLDRTGHGKISKSVNLHGGLGAQDLETIKSSPPQLGGRAAAGASGKEGTASN